MITNSDYAEWPYGWFRAKDHFIFFNRQYEAIAACPRVGDQIDFARGFRLQRIPRYVYDSSNQYDAVHWIYDCCRNPPEINKWVRKKLRKYLRKIPALKAEVHSRTGRVK